MIIERKIDQRKNRRGEGGKRGILGRKNRRRGESWKRRREEERR